MLWVERACLAPLVGLTLSGGCSESREGIGSPVGVQRLRKDAPAAIIARPLGPSSPDLAGADGSRGPG